MNNERHFHEKNGNERELNKKMQFPAGGRPRSPGRRFWNPHVPSECTADRVPSDRYLLYQYVLDLDMVANCSRLVTGVELLFGFVFCFQGVVPVSRLINGQIVYDDPANFRAGGLLKHTVASALKIFRSALELTFKIAGADLPSERTNRLDVGLHVNQWSLFVGWPSDVDAIVVGHLKDLFSSRPHRRACDLARPMP